MSDISSYIEAIETATRGEDVRDAIVDALNAVNEGGLGVIDSSPTQNSENAVSSGGVYAALRNIPMDDTPTENSTKPVSSGGVYAVMQNVSVTMDDTPTENSNNAVKSGGIYSAMRNLHDSVLKASIILNTTWSGSDPYTQIVSISNADQYSKVDIQPGATAIQKLIAAGVDAIWVENDNGIFVVCCIGGHPTEQMEIQCTITNTSNDPTGFVTVGVMNTALDGKVDKVNGKGLSTNDYTAIDQGKVSKLPVLSESDSGKYLGVDASGFVITVNAPSGGDGSGDMEATTYDPNGVVATAGGIAAYVTEQINAITDGNGVSY